MVADCLRLVNRQQKYLFIALLALFSINCGLVERLTSPGEDVLTSIPTRTPWPTFTPTAPIDLAQFLPEPTPTPLPTDTPLPTPPPTEPLPTAAASPAPKAKVTTNLNVRAGPGTNYPRLGQVTSGYTSDILGRNRDQDWILVNYSSGTGWISADYAQIEGNLNQVEIVEAAPPPSSSSRPAPTPVPPQASNPPPPVNSGYRYQIANVFGEKNGGITQIRGYVKDRNDQPANGVRVRVRIGSFCTISVPSGKPGVYPAGNYDVLLRPYASEGVWQVSVVDRPTDPEENACDPGAQQLSEEVRVTTSTVEGVTYVEFKEQ